MVTLDYLSVLNSELKEKLIGLCLDKKIMDGFNEDGKTMYKKKKKLKKKLKKMKIFLMNNK